MKILRIGMVACISVLFASIISHAVVVDRIVAVVNDEVITLSEVNRSFDRYVKRTGNSELVNSTEVADKIKRYILNTLVDQKIIGREAGKLGIVATDEQIDAAIKSILAKKKITMEVLQERVVKEGVTFEEYREEIRQQLTKINLVGKEIKTKITVSKKEIGEYYRQHRKEYEGKEAVRLNQILLIIPRNCSDETKDELRARSQELLERGKNGESIRSLAAEYSQGPAAKAGGDLGYVEKGMMLPEVDRVAFSLPVGALSEVIESSIGFHIIQVTDKRGAGIKPIDAVRDEIVAKIGEEKMDKKFQEWMTEMRKKSHVEIRF